SSALSRSSFSLSSETRSVVPRATFEPPDVVGTPIQSWNAVSSPANHLRRASSRESPPAEPPASQEPMPPDGSLLSHVEPRLSSGFTDASFCLVPQTTHSPCGFTSPPQTRQTWETVPSVGFTAIQAAPPHASRTRSTEENRSAHDAS